MAQQRNWRMRSVKLGSLFDGIGGALLGPSSYFMKSPPEQYTDDVCHRKVEEFIQANGHAAAVEAVDEAAA